MESPIYTERVETKFEVGICESGVPALSRDLARYVPLHEFIPGQQITLVSSVYFDNKEYDLLHYGLLSMDNHTRVRMRSYQNAFQPPLAVLDYWMELKIKKDGKGKKKRFRVKSEDIPGFFERKNNGAAEKVLHYNQMHGDTETIQEFYREIRDAISWLGLKPMLLVTYKRIAFQREKERVSVDWDIEYRHIGPYFYRRPFWTEVSKRPLGKEKVVRLELKFPPGVSPPWMADLQRRYPIWERKYYSKFKEGMRFLLQGPLKRHKKADFFLEMLEAYREDWRSLVA